MGENSAKRMRGGEMDDVIFGGTTARPARNVAEVTLHLDNSKRDAPAHYNEYDQIEVVRRIERGEGSGYRINGKEMRARDVQLLFADVASGAHSVALVSQGRIGAIINAKPIERRGLLEEAAGIAGLVKEPRGIEKGEEVGGILGAEECRLVMVKPPSDPGRTGILKVHDRVFFSDELLLVKQRPGPVQQPKILKLHVIADALPVKASEQGRRRCPIETLVVIKNPNLQVMSFPENRSSPRLTRVASPLS
jgi:hypothetical protein